MLVITSTYLLDIFDLETSVESHMQFCKSNYNMDERIRSQQIRGTDWAIRVHDTTLR